MTIILDHMVQGTPEWLEARVGCVTMSNAKKLLTGGKGLTRTSYIIEVASELASGVLAEKINTWDMTRGTMLEPFAAAAYEATTGLKARHVGLGYLDENRRIAASPDGLTEAGGYEIKCQAPKNHMRTIVEAKNPKQFTAQMQGCMWIFGVDSWDYCSFCPEFEALPLFILTVKRDEEMIKKISDAAHLAVEEIDEYVRHANDGVVSQQVADICDNAIELIDVMTNKEVEIL